MEASFAPTHGEPLQTPHVGPMMAFSRTSEDGALKPGTYCTVELHVPHDTPSLLVPAEAIIFNRNGLQVAVVESGDAHIRKVSVARDLGAQVEVRAGVKEGDMVVLNPQVNLVDGSKVQAQPQTVEASK